MRRVAAALAVLVSLIVAPLGLTPGVEARPGLTPPWLEAAFNPATVQLGSTTSFSFGIENQNSEAIGGVSFSDTLPAGLRVMNSTAAVCGGTLTVTKPSYIVLSGASIGATSWCRFSVTATSFDLGAQSTTTTAVTSIDTIDGNKASATANVYSPPKITAVFNPSSVAFDANTTFEITITSPRGNPITLTNIGVTANMPTTLSPFGGSGSACGGSLTFPSMYSFALTGASLAPEASCTFSVSVTGLGGGDQTATVVATLNGAGYTGNTASAVLHVAAEGPTHTHAAPTPASGSTEPAIPAAGSSSDATAASASTADDVAPGHTTNAFATPTFVGAPTSAPAGPTGGFPDAVVLIGLGCVGACVLVCLFVGFFVSKRRRAAR